MSTSAAVAYFAFNRPRHTALTLDALARNQRAASTNLYIFVDGPRNSAEALVVAEVVKLAGAANGFRNVSVHISSDNQGLYRSVTQGVSRVLDETGSVIVVEDDLMTSPFFLTYMNDALDRYANASQVGCIHAYSPPINMLPEYYFMKGGDCWGWATWADRWKLLNHDSKALIYGILDHGLLNDYLSIYGHHALAHLVARARLSNQSWASNWHASLFLAGKYTLHPGHSFVENIGNDGTGSHSSASDDFRTQLRTTYDGMDAIRIEHCKECARLIRNFMDGVHKDNWHRRIYRWLVTQRLILDCRRIHAQILYARVHEGSPDSEL